jgi:hypothetical protein
MGEERKCTIFLVGKLEGKRPLIRLRHRCKVGIRTDRRDIGWVVVGGVNSVGTE